MSTVSTAILFKDFTYSFERRQNWGEGQRERGKQTPCEVTLGLDPMTLRSRPDLKSECDT